MRDLKYAKLWFYSTAIEIDKFGSLVRHEAAEVAANEAVPPKMIRSRDARSHEEDAQ